MGIQKRFFDGKMYVEGLRQLRTFGVLAFVVLELEAVLVPLGYYVSLQQYSYSPTKQTLDFSNMHPLLVLCFTVFSPLMMLYLFHFLTKRNASDFYHALPNTRTSLFLSFFAAVMTWVTAAAVISSATSVLCFTLLTSYCTIAWPTVGVMVLNMLAASLFTAAAVAIAVCVSGTVFTNIVVSLLLIFLPRALLLIFTNYITSHISILSSYYLPPLVGMKYNVATNLIFGLFTGNVEDSFTFWQGGIYTLCVGLIYTVIAVFLFRMRKSETAGQAGPNRFLQTGIRLLLGIIVCVYPCISITSQILGMYTPSGDDYFLCLVFYIMAVVVCIIYELITTKKWKSVARIIPSLGILALLNVVMIGVLVGVYYSVLSFHPDAEDITHVELVRDENSYYSDYYNLIMEETELDDPQILTIVANRLQYETEAIRSHGNSYVDRSNLQTFAIHTKGQTVYRRLSLTSQEEKTIANHLAENPHTRRLYQTLPDPQNVSVNTNNSTLSQEQIMTLYTTFCQEVEEMDFAEWYAYLKIYTRIGSYYDNGGFLYIKERGAYYPDSLYVRCTVKGQSTYLNLPLIDLFPKTANLYMDYVNAQNQKHVLEVLASKGNSVLSSLSVNCSKIKDEAGNALQGLYFDFSDLYRQQEELQEFLDIITPLADTPPDIRSPLLALQVTYEVNYNQFQETMYIPYPEGTPLPDFLIMESGGMAIPSDVYNQ